MKKILSLLLLISLVLSACLVFASCGKDKLEEFKVPENGYDGSAVTITFYHTMGANLRAVLDVAIEDFNKLYPNITVVHEQTGNYDDVRDTIKTEIAVGAQPNLAYCYPDHVALYNLANAVVKLDDLIASEITVTRDDGSTESLGLTAEQIADFIPGYYEEGKQFDEAGTMYTIPLSKSTEVLYYNIDFFDEHNLSLPTTWDEMEELCKKIKEIDPQCIPLGYDSEANWFITMTEQYGSDYTSATGEHFLFDNDTNYQFVERFRDWYQKGYITTQELNGGEYSSKLFTATEGKRSYMSIGSSAGATHQVPLVTTLPDGSSGYPFQVGIATIPQVNPENPQVISQGPSLCIFNKKNPQEVVASWLFSKFLATNQKFQSRFSEVSGYVPVIQSVNDVSIYKNFLNDANGDDFRGFTLDELATKSTGIAQLVSVDADGVETVVTTPEVGKAYKFRIAYEVSNLYFNGDVNYFKRLNGTDDIKQAVDVYLEEAAGGYYFYKIIDKVVVDENGAPVKDDQGKTVTEKVKKYIELSTAIGANTKCAGIVDTPSCSYSWNTELNTLISNGNNRVFGASTDAGAFVPALSAKICLEQADAYYTSPAFNGSSTARDQVGILLQNCFTQTPASGESLRDMIKRLFQNAIEECEYQAS